MNFALSFALAQGDQAFRAPTWFQPVLLVLLVCGVVASLAAAVVGFSRARAFGPAVRWFALAAVCLLIFHVQILVIGFAVAQRDNDLVLSIGAFFNLFVVLAAVCSIIGFVRLTNPPH